MLARLNQLVPSWGGTQRSGYRIALRSWIAYVGDQLSYQQDSVAKPRPISRPLQPPIALRRLPFWSTISALWLQCFARGRLRGASMQVLPHRTSRASLHYAPEGPSTRPTLADWRWHEEAALLAGVDRPS